VSLEHLGHPEHLVNQDLPERRVELGETAALDLWVP